MLAACISINLLTISAQVLSSYNNFVCRYPFMSGFERRFGGYPEGLKSYVQFLNRRIPPDAVVLVPPTFEPTPRRYLKLPAFVQYALRPRKIIVAEDVPNKPALQNLLRARHITHILLSGCLYRMTNYPDSVRAIEFGHDRQWAGVIQELGLPAHYMPESVTIRLKELKVAMRDHSTKKIFPAGEGRLNLFERNLLCKDLKQVLETGDDGPYISISAEYFSDGGAVNPGVSWSLQVGSRLDDVGDVSAEVKSTIPESVCLFAVAADKDKRTVFHSPCNASSDRWSRLTVDSSAWSNASRPGPEATLDAVGICIMPLQRGYAEVR